MAKSEETKAPETERRPGLEPGAKLRDVEGERYSSPPLSYPDAPRLANSPAAMMLELEDRILQRLRNEGVLPGGKGPSPEQEIEAANRRAQERQERRSRDLVEHQSRLALYRAKGNDPRAVAGEIPGEIPGSGRRLVYQGETFRFAGDPGEWMEPLDEQARQRLEKERERRERIRQTAGETRLGIEAITQASDLMQRLAVTRERRAADATEHRAGAGG